MCVSCEPQRCFSTPCAISALCLASSFLSAALMGQCEAAAALALAQKSAMARPVNFGARLFNPPGLHHSSLAGVVLTAKFNFGKCSNTFILKSDASVANEVPNL